MDGGGRCGLAGRGRSVGTTTVVAIGREDAARNAERGTRARAREARAKANAEFATGTIDLHDYLDRLDDESDAARAYRDALVRHRRSMLDLNTAVGVRLLP